MVQGGSMNIKKSLTNTSIKSTLSITLGVLILTGCASVYQDPESFDDKMARFQAKNLSLNTVPNFKVAQIPLNPSDKYQQQEGRKPAALEVSPVSFLEAQENGPGKFSNRHLYFMTLYTQYNELKMFVDNQSSPKINSCPAFHTSFLQKKGSAQVSSKRRSYTPSPHITVQKLDSSNFQALYPELMLPLTKDNLHPTVADYFHNRSEHYQDDPEQFHDDLQEMVTKSLEIHLSKTYHELSELCEYGQSDNYYVYENLISYTQRNPYFGPSAKNMQTLLRTTLFSNMALGQSLTTQSTPIEPSPQRGRSIASIPQVDTQKSDEVFGKEVMERANADWSKHYFESLIRYR